MASTKKNPKRSAGGKKPSAKKKEHLYVLDEREHCIGTATLPASRETERHVQKREVIHETPEDIAHPIHPIQK